MKPIVTIITNYDPDKIKVKSEFDEKYNVLRIEVKLKKKKHNR